MAQKPRKEELIRIADIPELLLKLTGVTRTRQTVYEWIHHGRRTYDGRLIVLKTTKRLGRLFTTKQWLEKFVKELG